MRDNSENPEEGSCTTLNLIQKAKEEIQQG